MYCFEPMRDPLATQLYIDYAVDHQPTATNAQLGSIVSILHYNGAYALQLALFLCISLALFT